MIRAPLKTRSVVPGRPLTRKRGEQGREARGPFRPGEPPSACGGRTAGRAPDGAATALPRIPESLSVIFAAIFSGFFVVMRDRNGRFGTCHRRKMLLRRASCRLSCSAQSRRAVSARARPRSGYGPAGFHPDATPLACSSRSGCAAQSRRIRRSAHPASTHGGM